MVIQQIILLIINVLGGAAVLGSYVVVLLRSSSGSAFWGGVPSNIRPIYGVSMILAALGYFAFLYFIFFRIAPKDAVMFGRYGYYMFYVIFLAILVPSALWMPLTNLYLGSTSTGMWIAVRAVLIIVGLASIALVWALLSLQAGKSGIAYWLAVVGSGYFAFHTVVLDAIIWAALFR